ncbi:MAG: type II secretion system F family protein [Herpetosiphonaceae bacterium]|nr:type II secretion system F family protein [Herpetosiphonaceae bacterium]
MALLLVGILAVGGLGILVLALLKGRSSVIDDRLASLGDSGASLEDLELQLPFRERVLEPVIKSLLSLAGKVSPTKNATKLKHSLEMAGNPNGLTPSMFMGVRLVLAIVLTLGFFLLMKVAGTTGITLVMYTTIGGAIGYVMPGIWLGQKIKKRKHNILRSLPDALDLLTISVEAGLGFDLALTRVAGKWDNELSKEFNRMISDTRLGVPRRDAMRAMADRCSVEPLSSFVAAILQAEQLGASFGKILKVQSEQMRVKRRQRAEELAHQAPIKMLFPMAFLIFPSIMVIILGPAMPRLFGGAL